MADKILEREYVIPLRRELLKVPIYRRSERAVKAIKKFIAKHMKVIDRNVKNVRLDVYFNNDLWHKGRANPPTKVKVKAIKEGDIVRVNFVEVPEYVKFVKSKNEKVHKKSEKHAEIKLQVQAPEKTEEKKKDESEKEKSVAEQRSKEAKQDINTQKHTTKIKEESYHRQALKK